MSWDALAVAYDGQLALERHALERAVAWLEPRPDERVLDVATGTGAVLRALAALPAPVRPRDVLGIDSSPGMLERVPPLPPGFRTETGDATALPAADASVDAVACAYLLQLLDASARLRVLREIARVLRPDGRAVLVTVAPGAGLAGRPLSRLGAWSAKHAPRRLGGLAIHDPRSELRPAGLFARRVAVLRRGYPSYVVLAARLD